MYLAKYGVATKVRIPVVKRNVVDFAVGADWTPAAGDVKLSKDGGAAANITTLPTAIAMGNGAVWEFSFSATELQCAELVCTVADAATKAVEDQAIVVQTIGDTRAADPRYERMDLAQAGAAGTVTLDAAASAVDSYYLGQKVVILAGTGAGQERLITAYVGATKVATVANNWATNPDNTSLFGVLPGRAFIPAGGIATDAVDAAAVKADAVTEIQTGLATSAALATVQADTDDIQSRLPAALVGGRIDSSVGAMAAGVVTAAAVATDAIDADAIAADAVTEIAVPVLAKLPAALVGGRIDASVGAMAANVITAAAAAADFSTEVDLAILTAIAAVQADTDDIQGRLPAALVAGRIDANVGAMSNDVLTAAALAADAIAELWAAASAELTAVPTSTPSALTILQWLYQLLTNQQIAGDSSVTVTKADATVIATAAVTPAGTTVTRGRYA